MMTSRGLSGLWCASDPPTPDALRYLTLVIKVIINLANGASVGRKEEMLIPLSPLIDENLPRFREFFDAISVSLLMLVLPSPCFRLFFVSMEGERGRGGTNLH